MHILALSGSLRSGSANTTLLLAAAALSPAGTRLTLCGTLDELPYFRPGGYDEAPPPAVAAFRQQLRAADAVLISTPEYVFSMPGVLKNALEWLVSSAELYHKPVAVWSASPSATGGAAAHAGVVAMLTVMEARLVEAAALQVAQVSARISKTSELTDPVLREQLQAAVAALAEAAGNPAQH